ncbi:MAG: hypothetical protein UH687_07395 [Bacteroidaceae bacterium]|nr:hypothetical protein [Bacteroidaceae bacterium]
MLSFITEKVYQPWSKADIIKYEQEGSQRDTVLYNRLYDLRILLSEKNLYQCSIRVNHSKYKNFYLLAVRRNLFYLIMYVPQMDIIKDLHSNEIIRKCIDKLPTIRKFIHNSLNNANLEDEIQFCDKNCAIIKVNASIGEFLFPKRGYITNTEIKNKYALLNSIYSKCVNEFEYLGNMVDSYSKQLNEQIAKREQKVKDMLIRKGIRIGVSVGIAAFTGLYVDLDTVFGYEDIADAADIIDMADTADFYEFADVDYVDWNTADDLMSGDNWAMTNELEHAEMGMEPETNANLEDQYNVSFGKKNCPPNASSDGYIYHSEKKYKDYKVYKKNGKWWIWTEYDVWKDITKFIG